MAEKKIHTSEGIVEEEEDDDDMCCCYMPMKTLGDQLMVIALVFLVIGLAVASVGYVVPRDYNFDNRAPAREMEAREKYYADLGYHLDMCIIVGMSFVAVGGILTMSVFTYTVLFSSCVSPEEDSRKLVDTGKRTEKDYGSVTSS